VSENELAETVARFFRLLASLGVKAHITGGLAASYYGEPRFTQDIDIVVGADQLQARLDNFLKLLEGEYFYSEETIKKSLLAGRVFQLIDDATGFKFDIYPREGVLGELSRSENVELFPNQKLPILSVTDSIISKLQWVKKGSHKSALDVIGIFNRLPSEKKAEVMIKVEDAGLEGVLQEVFEKTGKEPD